MAVSDIGLLLDGSDLFPFLKRGTTSAFFHADGTEPWSREAWKRILMAGAISSAVSFNNLAGTPSGPEALCGLRFLRSVVVPRTFIRMLFINEYGLQEDQEELLHHRQ